jgi:hypothetical protein
MRDNHVNYQLVLPHNNRRNAAGKSIGAWKNHFIAGFSSMVPNFPMHLWCRLIPQATTTLNLLRQSRMNPRLSDEAQHNGAFDFNKSPMAPPGTRVVVHENRNSARPGRPVRLMAGTSVQRPNIIAATACTSPKHPLNAPPTQSNLFHITSTCPEHHPPTLPVTLPLSSSIPYGIQRGPHHSQQSAMPNCPHLPSSPPSSMPWQNTHRRHHPRLRIPRQFQGWTIPRQFRGWP